MKKAVLALAIFSISLALASAATAQAQDAKPLLLRQPTISRTRHRFHVRQRSLESQPRRRGRHPPDRRTRHQTRAAFFTRWPVDRFHGRIRRQAERVRDFRERWNAAPRHVPRRPGHRRRMDAGRQKYSLRLAARELSQQHPGSIHRARRRWLSYKGSFPHRLGRILLSRRQISRLSPHAVSLRQLEPLSRRHFSAHLDRESGGFQRGETSARRLERSQSACGSATQFISYPTATAPTRCSPTTQSPRRNRSSSKIRACPFKSADSGPGAIVYEQFGSLHLYDLRVIASNPSLSISIADLVEVRAPFRKSREANQQPAISPTGVRAVFEAHGEILTVPAEKGDIRNITNSPGVADRDPAWSPDGKSIAYFSDESGEYALHLRSQNGWASRKDRSRQLRRRFSMAALGRRTARKSRTPTSGSISGTWIWISQRR